MGAMGVLTKPVKTKETLDDTFAADQAQFIEPQHATRAGGRARRGAARSRRPALIGRRRTSRSPPSVPAAEAAAALAERPHVRPARDRPGSAGHERLRPRRRDPGATRRCSDVPIIVYCRPRADQEGRTAPQAADADDGAEGRPLARAAARRGGAVPAPPRRARCPRTSGG